jgi:chromosome segregation ATPase
MDEPTANAPKKEFNVFKQRNELLGEVERLTGELATVTRERDEAREASAQFDNAQAEVQRLTEANADLTGKLSAAETKVTEAEAKVTELQGKVDALPGKIEEAAADKAIDIAADAGVAPIAGTIKADSEKEPKNFAEYTATLATLEGAAAEAYEAKWLEKLSNKGAQ